MLSVMYAMALLSSKLSSALHIAQCHEQLCQGMEAGIVYIAYFTVAKGLFSLIFICTLSHSNFNYVGCLIVCCVSCVL